MKWEPKTFLDSRTLRGYNELLHHVSGSVVSHLSGPEEYSLESIIETIRTFGLNFGRVGEMDWAIRFALTKIESERMD